MTRALILFMHGSRDPKWVAPFERLQKLIEAQLPGVAVALAFLELMTPQLPELVERLVREGCCDAVDCRSLAEESSGAELASCGGGR